MTRFSVFANSPKSGHFSGETGRVDRRSFRGENRGHFERDDDDLDHYNNDDDDNYYNYHDNHHHKEVSEMEQDF